MNKTFKVVFNKARGALMVANEMTSSVQKKGVKTIVATAVAVAVLGMGGVAAAKDYEISTDTQLSPEPNKTSIYQSGDTVTIANGIKLTLTGITNQQSFFGTLDSSQAGVSINGNGDLILITSGDSADIGAAFGEGIKNVSANSIQVDSEGHGIYKSNLGISSTFSAKSIEIKANKKHALYTSGSYPITFEGFNTLLLASTEGHAANNNGKNATVTFTGGDATLTSDSRGALSTMGAGAKTTFNVNNLTVKSTIIESDDSTRYNSAVYVSGTLDASAKEAIRITAKKSKELTAFGLSVVSSGTATLTAGEISITSDDVGINVADSATVTLKGTTNINANKALQGTGNLVVNGSLTLSKDSDVSGYTGKITLGAGSELNASFATAYSGASINTGALVIDTGKNPSGKLTFANSKEGTLVIADTFTYNSGEDLEALASIYKNSVILNLKNATLAAGKTSTLVDGVIQSNATADVKTKTESGTTTATIGESTGASSTAVTTGAQTIVLDQSADVTVKANSNVTIVGKADSNNSAFIEKATKVDVAANATLNLGSASSDTATSGSLPAVTTGKEAKLNVTKATVTTTSMELGESSKTTITQGSVTATEGVTLSSKAELTVEQATITTPSFVGNSDAKITLGTDNAAGSLHADTLALNGATIFLDPVWKGNDTIGAASFLSAATVSELEGKLVVGRNSAAALGASQAEVVAAFDKLAQQNSDVVWDKDKITAALYLGQSVKMSGSETKIIVDGSLEAWNNDKLNNYASDVTIAENGLLMLDQSGIGSNTAFEGASLTLADGSYIGVINATSGTIKLATEDFDNKGASVITDNPFIVGSVDNASKSVVLDVSRTNGLGALASTGMQAMTRRADSVLAQTIADRTSVDQDYATGTALWVDVTGERYQADKMDNNASFKSDMGYGAFGGDFAITEDISAGAAIQYGKGTVRSSVSNIKNSIDSYGITAYGSMKFGDAKVVAEASYVKNENDITSSQTALNQSVDTDIYSLGIRGQHRFTAGQFQFVPSVGVRVSRLNTDAMKVGAVNIKKQEQTLVQVPIALRINGFEQNAGGWSVAPSFKIAYVPTFGDKEISVLGADQTVIDTSPVQGDFGIRAQKGNLMVNANFMVGGGKDGTSSVGGKAGLKYVF